MRKPYAAVATTEAASAAALEAMAEGGTSTDAVLAGFFACAGSRAGALFAPVQMLVAGPGVGAHAVDGRARQPGLGLARPRGFVSEREIPDAARVAVPASLAAFAAAHAHDSALSVRRIVAPGLAAARALGANERRAILDRVASLGASALRDARVARALLAAAAPAEGGMLGEADLDAVRPGFEAPRAVGRPGAASPSDAQTLVLPWPDAAPSRAFEVVAAADARGVFALLAFAPDDDGVACAAGEILLSRDATPVRRGVTRLRPGEPVGGRASLCARVERGVPLAVFGVASATALSDVELDELARAPAGLGDALGAIVTREGARAGLGVSRSPGAPVATAVLVKSASVG